MPADDPQTKLKISGYAIVALYLSLAALIVPISIVLIARENSNLALELSKLPPRTGSYIVAFLSFVGLVFAAESIRAGWWARKQIRSSEGKLRGKGRAWAGIILGCVGFFPYLFLLAISAPFSPLYIHPIGGGGASPVGSLRTIHTASEIYRETYHRGYPQHLSALGAPKVDGQANADGAGLIDWVLASGLKGGYGFYFRVTARDEKHDPSAYTVTAMPIAGCGKGGNCYFMDETGIIRMETSRIPDKNSPRLAG
jgi:hypothetical protein